MRSRPQKPAAVIRARVLPGLLEELLAVDPRRRCGRRGLRRCGGHGRLRLRRCRACMRLHRRHAARPRVRGQRRHADGHATGRRSWRRAHHRGAGRHAGGGAVEGAGGRACSNVSKVLGNSAAGLQASAIQTERDEGSGRRFSQAAFIRTSACKRARVGCCVGGSSSGRGAHGSGAQHFCHQSLRGEVDGGRRRLVEGALSGCVP